MTKDDLKNKITEEVSVGAENWGVDLAVSSIMQAVNKYIRSQSPTTADASVLKEALEKIMRMEPYLGRKGCTWGDTDYDSLSAAAGFNECLENIQSDISKALAQYSTQSTPPPNKIEDNSNFRGEVIGTIAYNPVSGDLRVTPDPEPTQTPSTIEESGLKEGEEEIWNEAIEKYKEQTGASVFATNLFKGWMKKNYSITKKP